MVGAGNLHQQFLFLGDVKIHPIRTGLENSFADQQVGKGLLPHFQLVVGDLPQFLLLACGQLNATIKDSYFKLVALQVKLKLRNVVIRLGEAVDKADLVRHATYEEGRVDVEELAGFEGVHDI